MQAPRDQREVCSIVLWAACATTLNEGNKKMKFRQIGMAAALAATFLLASCGGSSEPASTPASTTSVTYNSVREQDAAYLDMLDQGIPLGVRDTDLAVHRAGEICSSLNSGRSKDSEIQGWANGSGFTYGPSGAKVHVESAIDVYCPEHK